MPVGVLICDVSYTQQDHSLHLFSFHGLLTFQALSELCGLSERVAIEVEGALRRYAACKPAKLHTHVVRSLSLKELMRCFDLVVKMRSVELSSPEEEGVPSDNGAETLQQELGTVPLVLVKGLSEPSKFDLGQLLGMGVCAIKYSVQSAHVHY